MLFRGGAVAVVRKDSGEVKCQGGGDTLWQLLWSGVEDAWREMGNDAIAGEQVGAEHKPETLAVEAHMTVGVPWEMDCAQTMPHVDKVAIVEPPMRNEGPEA